MRALITGATGFIGEHLVRALVAEGHRVRVLVRDPKKARLLPQRVDVRLGDLTDSSSFDRLADDIDIIFHLGAALQGPWERHRQITVEGTRRMLESASAAGVRRFVHVSSLAVYDKSRIGPDQVINEASPLWRNLEVAGPYARGKIEAERLVQERAKRANMEYVIARPGLVYGPGHVIFEHLGLRLGRGTFLPIGGGRVRLPLVHIDSVVDALVRLAEAPDAAGRAFNIVDDEQASKREYVRALSLTNCRRYRCIGLPAAPLRIAARASEHLHAGGRKWVPKLSAAKIRSRTVENRYDCSALRAVAAWRPQHDLIEGLRLSQGRTRHRVPIRIQRVGIIGAGRIAQFHVNALRKIPGIEITGVFDLDQQAAESLAKRFNIPLAYSNADEFYRRARPQCVHILTPPRTHVPIALDAMRRGSHIFVEKPVALTLDECRQLQRAADENCVTIGIDHNYVSDARVRRARTMIERSAIGDLVHIDIFWAFDIRRFHQILPTEPGQAMWVTELAGGPLEDLAPHPLSLALHLVNEEVRPAFLHAFRSGRLEHAFDDEMRVLLAGRSATVNVGLTLSAAPDDLTVVIHGTRSTLRLDLQNLLMIESRQGPGPKAVARGLRVLSGGAGTIVQTVRNAVALALKRADPPACPNALIRDHYAALTAGTPLPADLEQGCAIVEIIRAIWPALSTSPDEGADAMRSTRATSLSPGGRLSHVGRLSPPAETDQSGCRARGIEG